MEVTHLVRKVDISNKSWLDIIRMCPVKEVLITRYRWVVPNWIPFFKGLYFGYISTFGKLEVKETKEGWTFYHPGFDNGEHSIPVYFSNHTPGGIGNFTKLYLIIREA